MKRLLSVLALFAAACQNAPNEEEPLSPGAAATLAEPGGVLDRDVQLAKADEQIKSGHALEALATIDELHTAKKDDDRSWYLFGKAAYAAAESGQSTPDLYQDAQSAFERAVDKGYGTDALLGASRAARM